MRVLLDCRMASWSGIGRYTRGLAQALADSEGVEILQLLPERRDVPAPAGSAPAVRASSHPFSIRGAVELARIADRSGCDLVHCLHFPTPLPVRHSLVVTIHDLIPLAVPNSMPRPASRMVYRRWNARAARVADRIIVPSHHTARDVALFLPSAAAKTTVIPEAVEGAFSQPAPPLPRRLADLCARPYALAFASAKAHKGLPVLLGAFARLVAAGREERLLLVGGEEALRARLNHSVDGALRSRLMFTDPVTDDELRGLYAGSKAFIFPSTYEGFGLPVLEAMASGAPVVCSDAASLPEVAGEAAQLFRSGDERALADALLAILGDEAIRARLSEAGRQRAATFSWGAAASATVAVYEVALTRSRRSPSHGGHRRFVRPSRPYGGRPV